MSRPPNPIRPYQPIDRRSWTPYRRSQRLSDFLGWPMTVCIAINCDELKEDRSPKLLLITDMMASGSTTSIETAVKIRHIHQGWYAMFAGNDISALQLVIGPASRAVKSKEDADESRVAIELVKAYQFIRRKQVEDQILSPFGIKIADFLKEGAKYFPPAQYSQLFYQIETFDLGFEILVAGFAKGRLTKPSIFHIQNPGTLRPDELLGFAAIGTGALNAISYLATKEQTPFDSFELSLYNGIAAKAMAEKALGVGPKTMVVYLEAGQENAKLLRDEQVRAIRKIWKKGEADVRPRNLQEKVKEILKANTSQE